MYSTGLNQETTREASEPLTWAPLVLTEGKIRDLWFQIQQFPQVFDDFTRGDFDDFVNRLVNPANIFIDIGPGLGLAAGFAVKPGLDTVLHLVMFDRRLRGREGMFLDIMGYFFKKLKLRRMTAIIADDCKTAIKLVGRLGFVKEGAMRGAILRDGKFLDAHIFGILREEHEATTQSSRSAACAEARA